MKAMLCKENGPIESLVLEDFELSPPGEGEVRVRVRSAGVNFPDILITEGKYQFKPVHPFPPGSECAGDVISVGPGVTDFKSGEKLLEMRRVADGSLQVYEALDNKGEEFAEALDFFPGTDADRRGVA